MKKDSIFFRALTLLVCGFLIVSTATQNFAQVAAAAVKLGSIESKLAEDITIASIKGMTSALSAPEMEGRGTGQLGGDKAANWIAEKFKSLGLAPLGDKGSYLQKVDFKEIVTLPETQFLVDGEPLAHGNEFGLLPQNNGNKSVSGGLVFVSYGIQAKEAKIDMLSGVNISGKIVVMIEGPPPGFEKASWEKQQASMAIMRTLIFSGAAGIVFIGRGDEERPPEEMISYITRRQIAMPDEEGYPPQIPPMAYVSAKGAEKLFAKSGMTAKDAITAGHQNSFKAMDLKSNAKITAKYKSTKVIGNNVVGVLEGSDPKLKAEAIVFSAHYDAYGIDAGKIYPGAADNALGTAEMLSVAEAFSKMSPRPKRSLIFIAVTGEEYGLYGSKYWAKNPTWEIKKIAANLNLDGIGSEVYGPVKTMVGFGGEHSTLGPMLESLAKLMDIAVIADPMPDEKTFYRSDHYSFVERGIPSLMLLGAPAGPKEIWMKRIKDWEKVDYHQVGDVIQPTWAWEGAETVAEIMAILGWRISETETMPSWLSTSRFAKLERGNSKPIPEEK